VLGLNFPPTENLVEWPAYFGEDTFLALNKIGLISLLAMIIPASRIERALAEARAERAGAEAEARTARADLDRLDVDRARIQAEAEGAAAELVAATLARAAVEVQAVRARGRVESEAMKRQGHADLVAELAELARASTEAIVVGELDRDTRRHLVDDYIEEVRHLRAERTGAVSGPGR
jgi:F0F1-type ATP synthase membrane subunit b/b'